MSKPKFSGAAFLREQRMTRAKSEILANRIKQYRLDHGQDVRVWLEPFGGAGAEAEYVVRSDIDLMEPAA